MLGWDALNQIVHSWTFRTTGGISWGYETLLFKYLFRFVQSFTSGVFGSKSPQQFFPEPPPSPV